MKKTILIIMVVLFAATVAFAGTISGTGMNQGDLFNLLSKMVTLTNELRTDVNTLSGTAIKAGSLLDNYSSAAKRPSISAPALSLTQ